MISEFLNGSFQDFFPEFNNVNRGRAPLILLIKLTSCDTAPFDWIKFHNCHHASIGSMHACYEGLYSNISLQVMKFSDQFSKKSYFPVKVAY